MVFRSSLKILIRVSVGPNYELSLRKFYIAPSKFKKEVKYYATDNSETQSEGQLQTEVRSDRILQISIVLSNWSLV